MSLGFKEMKKTHVFEYEVILESEEFLRTEFHRRLSLTCDLEL
jgi:hypothetical protein